MKSNCCIEPRLDFGAFADVSGVQAKNFIHIVEPSFSATDFHNFWSINEGIKMTFINKTGPNN